MDFKTHVLKEKLSSRQYSLFGFTLEFLENCKHKCLGLNQRDSYIIRLKMLMPWSAWQWLIKLIFHHVVPASRMGSCRPLLMQAHGERTGMWKTSLHLSLWSNKIKTRSYRELPAPFCPYSFCHVRLQPPEAILQARLFHTLDLQPSWSWKSQSPEIHSYL